MTINEKISTVLEKHGVFFALSNKQFEEQKQEGVTYCTVLQQNDCVPVENAKAFADEYIQVCREHREEQLKQKGIDTIIEEELVNQEAFYSASVEDTFEALAGYNVTREKVREIYNKVAHKYSDW